MTFRPPDFRSALPHSFVYHQLAERTAPMRSRKALILWFSPLMVWALIAAAGKLHAEETITLTDGRTLSGTIVAEDDKQIIVKLPDGDQRALLKSRVAAIAKATPAKPPVEPAPAGKPIHVVKDDMKELVPSGASTNPSAERIAVIKELGASQPLRRQKAAAEILKDKESHVPIMLAMLHPKQPTDEYTRIGILRTLVDCVPLSDQAAATLGYMSLFDPYPEARREACVTIRTLADDRAMREIMKYAASPNAAIVRAVAVTLHEIDDPRVLLALIRALPQPSVTSSNVDASEVSGLDKPAYQLPVGPGGASMPIFLPSGPVNGIATDLDSPAVPLLKQIAGKDLGNLAYGWFNWYREKTGEIGKTERDQYNEKRSIRDRMNR